VEVVVLVLRRTMERKKMCKKMSNSESENGSGQEMAFALRRTGSWTDTDERYKRRLGAAH
jgi:hypothetical protein